MFFGAVKTAPKTTPKRRIEQKIFTRKWSKHPLSAYKNAQRHEKTAKFWLFFQKSGDPNGIRSQNKGKHYLKSLGKHYIF